ncbi:MAG: MerR family transcriptional regulator [Alkalibacterium sp.]|nr:MerR family transcriptional regulator [Alkalibacterium sp.]
MKNKRFLKTAELAALLSINKRTLHYYDAIGLFSPERRESNGYRYYSLTQIMDLSIILSLRELDMPLTDIKEILTGSFQAYTESLETKKVEVDAKIRDLHNIRDIISRKLAYIETAERSHMTINELVLEDSYLILSERIKDQSILNLLDKAHQLVEKQSNYTLPNNEYGSLIHTDKKREDPHSEEYDYLYIDAPVSDKSGHLKPAGRYLSLVYQGTEESLSLPYEKILQYSRDNGLQLEGYFYEKVLLDSIQKNQDHTVIEIQVRIA